MVCLNCRKTGHSVSNCYRVDKNANNNICFNCGSSDHRLRDCLEERVSGGTQYATCMFMFVCL